MERIILCKLYAISGGIETFYIITKNTNLGSSTIYLVVVDMIEIANLKLIIKTYFYMIQQLYELPICSWNIRVFIYMV